MPESDATLADLHVARVPFAIRRCRADDLGSLEWFGEFRDHREIIERTFAQTGAGTQAMWIADVNGFPAGQLWVDLQRDRLWAARVLQPLRGCGLGSALTRRAERDLAARGRTHAAVSVETGNPCGLRFWLRAGYRHAARTTEAWSYTTPDGVHVDATAELYVLEKDLTEEQHHDRSSLDDR